ncbi:NUDIX hydrolase [uncultured virus]|nr:NUDIX hydrolase [uncultured virus]
MFNAENNHSNDLIFDNNIDQNKKKYKKKYKSKFYCGNCGNFGHLYKFCNEAITSLGMILVAISTDDNELIVNIIDKFKNKTQKINDDNINIKTDGIYYENLKDIETFCKYKDNVKFLLIRRKYTLGYIEFLRGRYNIENVDGIIYLFRQMTSTEIKKIGNSQFNELWEELWGNNSNKFSYQNEYVNSKHKFEKLKNECDNYLNLNFYVEHISPTWEFAEWGFPKGRRNFQENDINCALREFKEESGFNDNEFILLDKIYPMEEQLIGTNGINYKHIYYIGVSSTDKLPNVDPENKNQVNEIGEIGWFTFEEAINLIRPYHIERKKLLIELYMYFINTIVSQFNMNLEKN